MDWARVGAGGILERGADTLERIKNNIPRGDRVLALVPGERVLLHHVNIPARSRSAQLQALPFALEDRISEDLDAMHIVPGPRLANGAILAAVVARRDMDIWLEWLDSAGVRPDQMLPDTALLPEAPSTGPQIYQVGERCVVAVTGEPPVALSLSMLDWWLQRQPAGRDPEQALAIEWHAPSEVAANGLEHRPGVTMTAWDGDWLDLLAASLRQRPGLNLFSGAYAPPGSAVSWQRWRLPAIIGGVLALLWASLLGLELRQLEQETRQLDLAISDLFEATLPDTRMVDPVGQFRQRLDADSEAVGTGAGAVAARLDQVAPLLAAAEVELRQLRAEGNRLELELDLESIARLDTLRARLGEGTGATVRILSAESDEDRVRARLQLEGGGP